MKLSGSKSSASWPLVIVSRFKLSTMLKNVAPCSQSADSSKKSFRAWIHGQSSRANNPSRSLTATGTSEIQKTSAIILKSPVIHGITRSLQLKLAYHEAERIRNRRLCKVWFEVELLYCLQKCRERQVFILRTHSQLCSSLPSLSRLPIKLLELIISKADGCVPAGTQLSLNLGWVLFDWLDNVGPHRGGKYRQRAAIHQ